MPEFDIPPKPNLSKQLLTIAVVLLVVGVVAVLLTQYIIGFIIFLIAVITGAYGERNRTKL